MKVIAFNGSPRKNGNTAILSIKGQNMAWLMKRIQG